MSRSRLWSLAAAVVVIPAILGACATNPVTGKKGISLVSPAQELEIGQQGYGPVVREFGLYDDPALQSYVNAIGQKIARVSHLPDLEWHFTLLDDPAVNAFAMPGGYIYITRGILPYLNSEAQIAGVLAHEIGHVTYRHTASMITQQQLYGLGLALGSLVSPAFQRYSGVAQQALGLLFLKYSRTHETEADQLAIEYATKAGYDARDISATYGVLKRIGEQSGQRLPGFLSTHPDPGDRERVTAELAAQAVAGKTGLVVNHDPYVQRMDNIVFDWDPRQGYFDGDIYFHPTLTFQISFPAGWKHQDSHSSVAAIEPTQAAVVQLSDAQGAGDLTPDAFVAQLKTNGSITGSSGSRETIGGFAAWVGHVNVMSDAQTTIPLAAGFIRKGTVLFQILGQSRSPGDADEQRIFATLRSFRGLTDPARLHVAPDRVRVRSVSATASFESIMGSLGAASTDLETNAIMNDLQATDRIVAGTLVKVVVRAR